MKRTGVLVAMLAVAMLTAAVPARANLFSGTCLLNVTISFPGKLKIAPTSNYAVTVTPAVDLDGGTSGDQSCAATFTGLEPRRKTTVTVDEDTINSSLSCLLFDASGEWTQSFTPATPPQVTAAPYHITGSPAAPIIDILSDDGAFIGAIVMVAPFFALDATACSGSGISSVSYTAVQVFQDP